MVWSNEIRLKLHSIDSYFSKFEALSGCEPKSSLSCPELFVGLTGARIETALNFSGQQPMHIPDGEISG